MQQQHWLQRQHQTRTDDLISVSYCDLLVGTQAAAAAVLGPSLVLPVPVACSPVTNIKLGYCTEMT